MVRLVDVLQLNALVNQDVARTNAAAAIERLAAVRREREEVDAYLAQRLDLAQTGIEG